MVLVETATIMSLYGPTRVKEVAKNEWKDFSATGRV